MADQVKRRRHSSVGKIELGDMSVPSLQTRRSSKDIQKTQSLQKKDVNKITNNVNDSSEILAKLYSSIKILCYNYVWLPPLIFMILLNGIYLLSNNYTESNPLHRFLRLSYGRLQSDGTMAYNKGWKDFAFVSYMIIFFTFLREFVIQMMLKPLAKYCGVTGKSKTSRFTEQAYAIFYYAITSPWGLYIMYHSPMWFFNTTEFYRNYPHTEHDWLFKFYYLFQAGFWSQQSIILMLQVEKPRKDFKELVFHHIVTILLVSLSYMFNFTHIGLAIYITMDVSDFFLGFSKTLNYIDSPAELPFFIVFVSSWIYTRHYLNLKILWSILTEFLTVGPNILDFKTQQYKCWISQPMVFSLLFALQLVNLYWLFLILRIAVRFLLYNVKKDDRSDSESDDEEGEEAENDKKNS